MSGKRRSDRGDWVSLLDGVRVSRGWMSRHVPNLLAAWRDARTTEARRAIAKRILKVAAHLESEDIADAASEPALRELVIRIDARLVRGPDWLPLAAALSRAAFAGYDVAARLPVLAAAAPLPARHPARELHWRLLGDCAAALLTLAAADYHAMPAHGSLVVHSRVGSPQICRGASPAGRGDASFGTTGPGGRDTR
ncbi:hypothetical protein SAMN05660662_0134 [Blastococcus aurantiacus]|uniref:Uncharacterized protein n=1 Tax=Blastococcus aurantiacus TaxID=1550231 RepID=A0A1G7R1T2_9ACTN|nr:hypothetical protein [Blastococcus aurantiacus]SDG04697.1 hypothetical protein SAMN05660662_0134 [Blastococcus aurantiacus]